METVQTGRVLVVEDDAHIRGMLVLLLASEGFDVDVDVDGDGALGRLAGPPPALVVLDVMMPGTDGLTVLRALRTAPGWEHVPVIVVTALSDDEDLWAGWQAGADYYLTKPFDIDELRQVVIRLATGGAANRT